MPKPSIDLEWWPPDGTEPIGEKRATELAVALRTIAGPVVEEAVADVRQRSHADTEIIRSGAPGRYLARVTFGPEMRTVCVGTVYEVGGGDPHSCSLHLDREGRLTWRRD